MSLGKLLPGLSPAEQLRLPWRLVMGLFQAASDEADEIMGERRTSNLLTKPTTPLMSSAGNVQHADWYSQLAQMARRA